MGLHLVYAIYWVNRIPDWRPILKGPWRFAAGGVQRRLLAKEYIETCLFFWGSRSRRITQFWFWASLFSIRSMEEAATRNQALKASLKVHQPRKEDLAESFGEQPVGCKLVMPSILRLTAVL